MTTETIPQEAHEHDDHRRIVLVVSAPNDPDPKRIPFELDSLVGDAAKEAADKFDYAPGGNPSFRLADGTVLDRTITLAAAGLENRDQVDLVDTGGGV